MVKTLKLYLWQCVPLNFKKTYENKDVVVDKNFITAKSLAYTIPFALAGVNKLLKKATAEKVAKEICCTGKII